MFGLPPVPGAQGNQQGCDKGKAPQAMIMRHEREGGQRDDGAQRPGGDATDLSHAAGPEEGSIDRNAEAPSNRAIPPFGKSPSGRPANATRTRRMTLSPLAARIRRI